VRIEDLLPLLACPTCHGVLVLDDPAGDLRCVHCRLAFPVEGGIPNFLPGGGGEAPEAGLPVRPFSSGFQAFLDRFGEGLVLDAGAVQPHPGFPHVLVAGPFRFPETDVVTGVGALPFRGEAFDAVVCDSALEYAPDPFRFVGELHRVLKEGGEIRIDTGWPEGEHEPYFQLTRKGLFEALRVFEGLDAGEDLHHGPGFLLASLLKRFREGIAGGEETRKFMAFSVEDLIGALDRDGGREAFGVGPKGGPGRPGGAVIRARKGRGPVGGGSKPSVSVVVLNYNGKKYLEGCLESLMHLDYPSASLEILLVDNGSTDGSAAFVGERFPRVKIVSLPENVGHGEGNNLGVREASGRYVALLNNDTRVDPGWVEGFLEVIHPGDGTLCAASKMLSMDGKSIDYVGGITSFMGHIEQMDHGSPAVDRHAEPVPLLYPCSGAMLIDRSLFLRAGGFDPAYFIYYDDVDLGWRLWLLGYRVALAPRAVTYHDFHGHMRSVNVEKRIFLCERNVLYTLYKNFEEANLWRVLSASVLLQVARGFVDFPIDGAAYDYLTAGEFEEGREIPASAQAYWAALADFARRLPELEKKRSRIQRDRVRSDRELFPLFVDPLHFHPYSPAYADLVRRVRNRFGIEALFSSPQEGVTQGGQG
jgi:GT2 family glycosyltransferase/uncharacterized protein YbaR (Trm112 family)/SAM-dependent methyltransferase